MEKPDDANEYADKSLEELVLEETKTKQTRLIFLVVTLGVTAATLYGIATHQSLGFGPPMSILFSLFMLMRSGSTLDKIRAEMQRRNTP